jgi:hypothetical protein
MESIKMIDSSVPAGIVIVFGFGVSTRTGGSAVARLSFLSAGSAFGFVLGADFPSSAVDFGAGASLVSVEFAVSAVDSGADALLVSAEFAVLSDDSAEQPIKRNTSVPVARTRNR